MPASSTFRLPQGLLVGIGEDWGDRIRSLELLAELQHRYRHLQEVIIQPFAPKPRTRMADVHSPSREVLLRTVALARHLLPDDVRGSSAAQPHRGGPASQCRGVRPRRDFRPWTVDYINPSTHGQIWQTLGIALTERLPIYPQYVRAGWYSEALAPLIGALADERGFRRETTDETRDG